LPLTVGTFPKNSGTQGRGVPRFVFGGSEKVPSVLNERSCRISGTSYGGAGRRVPEPSSLASRTSPSRR
jgi:hypothetical protein